MDEKHCPQCGMTKSVAEFNKNKRRADGRTYQCRDCYRAYCQANREAIRERRRAYNQQNRDAICAQKRAHYQENRDAVLEWTRAHYQENRDALVERARAYRQENQDLVRERARAYRKANAAHWAEHNPYLEHPTGKKECRRKHGTIPVSRFSRNSSNADGLSAACRECSNTAGETRADRAAWAQLARTRPPCIYCGAASQHIDHVHPVSRGGRDIATNYAPACQPCNTSKGAKWVFDFLFGTEGIPDTEKPASYQSWDAPFLTELFAELERPDDARP